MEAQESFVVEYGCEKHCRVDVDVDTINSRSTHRQMREHADAEHDRVHPPAKNRDRRPPPAIRKPVVSSPFLR